MDNYEKNYNNARLILKYLRQDLSVDEQDLLEQWLAGHQDNQDLFNRLTDEGQVTTALAGYVDSDKEAVRKKILESIAPIPKHIRLWPRIAAAVCIIFAIGAGLWFYGWRKTILKQRFEITVHHDIGPGKNKATITLADGKSINLSEDKTGVIIDASKITYNDGSVIEDNKAEVRHPGEGRDPASAMKSLTITTPRGGTYQIKLPDGTKVWLNAASSLTYNAPLKQQRAARKVTLTGEAYFEVFKDKSHPFVVLSERQAVKVLGTHFNVNAYKDEASTKTTLLEGAVQVSASGTSFISDVPSSVLKPGQQATLSGNTLNIKNTDVEEVVAWKNGRFWFENEDLPGIMRKLSRWYDVDVIYDGGEEKYKKLSFGGFVSRSKNISEVLKIINKTNKIHVEIEGRRVLIRKE